MVRDPNRATHNLWSEHDSHAPFEVRRLGKAICKDCGAEGTAIYDKPCPGPQERQEAEPTPHDVLARGPEAQAVEDAQAGLVADLDALTRTYQKLGLTGAEIGAAMRGAAARAEESEGESR